MDFVTQYATVKKEKANLRGALRHQALNGLSLLSSMKEKIAKNTQKDRIQFLYFHHIFPDEEATFRQLLQELSKSYTFISYSDAVEKILNNDIDKPYINISSDDAFKNNLRAAAIMDEFDAKGCFFVNPSIVGETNFEKIKTFSRQRLNFPPVEYLTWDEVHDLMKNGHEIGNHTMNHANLGEVSKEVAEEEITTSLEALQKRCGEIKHFAWPYGKFSAFNNIARDIVFKTGHRSCCSATRGCHIPIGKKIEASDLCIRRDHMILEWPVSHILHFINNNASQLTVKDNYFPYPEN